MLNYYSHKFKKVIVMKKLSSMLILGLFLVSILAFGVSAEAYVPADLGNGLSGFFTGLKELFTGGETNYDNWYLLSFLLYFVIFIAIFWEGAYRLPLFGAKGEINGPGKAFCFAAAGLGTLSIFFVEQASQKTTREMLQNLLAPFGIYGAFAIAALLTFITYKFLTDTELFAEQTMMAIAIAASVGLVSVGYILTSSTLLGWGFMIMILVVIVGLIMAFGSSRREGDELAEEGKEKTFWGAIRKVRGPLRKYGALAVNEYVWLKRIKKEVNASTTLDGVDETARNVHVEAKANRTNRKMKRREVDLIDALRKLGKENVDWKGKVEGVINKIEVLQNTLVAILSSGGELDNLLERPCTASWTKNKKKNDIQALINRAIAADNGIVVLVRGINKDVDDAQKAL
jgi:hypothetical protein